MEKFLLITREGPDNVPEWSNPDSTRTLEEYQEWIKLLRASGHYVSGSWIADTNRRVSKHYVITDFEYTEINPLVLGYDIILAENMKQAINLAKICPLVKKGIAVKEVRQILPLLR